MFSDRHLAARKSPPRSACYASPAVSRLGCLAFLAKPPGIGVASQAPTPRYRCRQAYPSARPIRSETRATLIASIARGRRWLNEIRENANANVESIAKRVKCSADRPWRSHPACAQHRKSPFAP